jgi:hypothetical protein
MSIEWWCDAVDRIRDQKGWNNDAGYQVLLSNGVTDGCRCRIFRRQQEAEGPGHHQQSSSAVPRQLGGISLSGLRAQTTGSLLNPSPGQELSPSEPLSETLTAWWGRSS